MQDNSLVKEKYLQESSVEKSFKKSSMRKLMQRESDFSEGKGIRAKVTKPQLMKGARV